MQAALVLTRPAAPAASTFCSPSASAANYNARPILKGWATPSLSSRQRRALNVCYAQQQQAGQDYVVYDEKKSVFPAEACEEVGGDACDLEGVGPEVKAKASRPAKEAATSPLGGQDREYIDYKEAKTVFPGEACDELGGEFCEPEYQSGVFPEKTAAK